MHNRINMRAKFGNGAVIKAFLSSFTLNTKTYKGPFINYVNNFEGGGFKKGPFLPIITIISA